ncbi:sodium:solute symporter family protein [candidate division KSB1 bacterium]|nr:sodium:solute symporter family protein [candidate division KSB1 bacterium]
MRLHGIDLAVPLLFLVALPLIGLLVKRRRDADEFMLMGRALTAPAFVMSLVASWYGGILGISEYSFKFGLSNWFVFGLPYYLHALLFATLLARRARVARLVSIPDRLETAYGQRPARLAALVIFLTTMPAAYLLMVGKLFAWMFGWPYPVALVAATVVSTIYIYGGGLRSIVRTDVWQFLFMYGGFAVMVAVLVTQFGGVSFLREHVPTALFTPLGGQGFFAVFVWYIIASTTLIEPLFYERVYAAKSERIVLPAILTAVGFWMLFDFMTTTTGLYARALLPELTDPAFAFPELAHKVLPAGVLGLFIASLLAVVMSTVDSYTFIAAAAFGRDLIWKSGATRDPGRVPALVRFGLIVATVCAFTLALASESVIALWHALGSISAPILLIPTLAAWTDRARFSTPLVLPAMLVSGVIALVWRLWPELIGDAYPFDIEPIYAGLFCSLLFYLAGLLRATRHSANPAADATDDAAEHLP